jgi:GTP-binding protein EngB required for normal cell division
MRIFLESRKWRRGRDEIMVDQQKYLDKLSELEAMVKKYGVGEQLSQKIRQCQEEMAKFSLKILFVGGFSAGKSALLNTLLDRDVFVENQRPETTIASEMFYDENEYIELFKNNGGQTECLFEEIASYPPDQYNHFTYHVKNDFIKKYPHYTLVDMPGFNSGIDRHNKAIMQYANQGNAYVLVIDCEDGEIKSSSLDFLKEIKQYENNLAIVLTKADKKPESHVKEVLSKVKKTAEQIFQKEIVAVTTSKFDHIEEQMHSILSAFNAQSIFEQAFKSRMAEISQLILAAIEKVAQSYHFDDGGLEEEIKSHQKAKDQLVKQLMKERKKLSAKMKNQVKPSIIADVQNVLYSNSASLASNISAGGDSFTRAVNNLLRPVLITSTQRYTEESFHEFMEEIDFESIFSDRTMDTFGGVATKLTAVTSSLQKLLEVTDKTKGLYRVITGALAITTTVVAPWLELIIVFLPDILKLIGLADKNRQMEDLKRKIETEIIPQIVSKMSVEIEKSLEELEEDLLAEVEDKMSDLIEIEAEAMQSALTMRKTKEEDYQKLQSETANDINQIQLLVSSL